MIRLLIRSSGSSAGACSQREIRLPAAKMRMMASTEKLMLSSRDDACTASFFKAYSGEPMNLIVALRMRPCLAASNNEYKVIYSAQMPFVCVENPLTRIMYAVTPKIKRETRCSMV